MKKTVLVIGGTGFIGNEVVKKLLQDTQYNVISFSRHQNENCPYFLGDVQNLSDLEAVFNSTRIDATLILYGLKSIGNSSDTDLYTKNDYGGLNNILSCCKKYGCKKVVYLSSSAVYAEGTNLREDGPLAPKSFYSYLKISAEKLLEQTRAADGIEYVALRCFNVVGFSKNKGTNDIISLLAKNNALNIFGEDFNTADGTLIRDYVYVKDVAAAVEKAILYGGSGIFNLGTGHGYSVKEIIQKYKEVSGKEPEIKITNRRSFDQAILSADISRAKELLGWVPEYSLEKMIKEIICDAQ